MGQVPEGEGEDQEEDRDERGRLEDFSKRLREDDGYSKMINSLPENALEEINEEMRGLH